MHQVEAKPPLLLLYIQRGEQLFNLLDVLDALRDPLHVLNSLRPRMISLALAPELGREVQVVRVVSLGAKQISWRRHSFIFAAGGGHLFLFLDSFLSVMLLHLFPNSVDVVLSEVEHFHKLLQRRS